MCPSARDPYEVTDVYAAATLVAAGFRLAAIEPDPRGAGPTRFLFDPDDRLADTLTQHYRGALSVNADRYAGAIRKLRPWAKSAPVRTTLSPRHFGRQPSR